MAQQLLPLPSVAIADAHGNVSREWWRWFSQLSDILLSPSQGVNQLTLLALIMRLTDMTIASAVLFGPVVVSNGVQVLYRQPTDKVTVVTRADVTNIGGADAHLTIWLVRSGISRDNTTMIFGAISGGVKIPAGPADAVVINALTGLVLAEGDTIYGVSDTIGALNMVASGWTQ